MMNPALKRWSNKDETRMNDIVGIIDSHSSRRHGRNSQSNDRLIVTSMGPEFPDDLSTIAGDTIANTIHSIEEPPGTPEKMKSDESATQPETPQKLDSSTKSMSSIDYERNRAWCMCRVATAAGFMAFILVGAIAIMAFALHRMRNENTVSNQELATSPPNTSWVGSLAFNSEDMQGNASTVFPVETSTAEPIEESQQNDTSPIDSIRTMILSTAPYFYTNPDMLSVDPNSVHYKVMNWILEDPSFSSYSTSRVLQRFALGVTYWSLAPGATDVTQVGWMDYNDECDWPQNQKSPPDAPPPPPDAPQPSACNPDGSTVAVNMEGMGFVGTIAPEVGLLSSLENLDLKSNNITGALPTELGFLTSLRRLNLAENHVSGVIPTEIGLLNDLDMLSLGFNNLVGSVPTEIGLLQNLKRIDLQTNSLTGQLPEELSSAAGLEALDVEFNQFSGPISPGIGNLVNLRVMSLQGNDFSGTMPAEVCAISNLTIVSIDCEDVICACCATCEGFFGLPTNESATATPTIAATTPATIAATTPGTVAATAATTVAPTTIATATPTTATTTTAPTLCQEVKTEKSCYEGSEAIDFEIFNCNPTDQDFVAFYRTQDLVNSGTRIALFWIPSCMSNDCHWMLSGGTLFSGNVTIMDTPLVQWPLAADEYKFLLFKIHQPDSLEVLAESVPFQVADLCQ